MTAKPNPLRIVPVEPPPEVHISDLLRADIMKRDWRSVHIISANREPIHLPDRKVRNVTVPVRWERTR